MAKEASGFGASATMYLAIMNIEWFNVHVNFPIFFHNKCKLFNIDELVKSGKTSHSRLHGNDIFKRKWGFYETVNIQ